MKRIITAPILNPLAHRFSLFNCFAECEKHFQRKGLVSLILTALFLLPFGKAGMGYAQTVITSTGTPVYHKMLADSTEFDVVGFCPVARLNNPQQTLSNCINLGTCNSGGIWYAKKDSIYKGKAYKKVTSSYYYYYSPTFQGLIREDTILRKVYFIPYCDTTEDLLYDFSLLQGDTISYSFPNSCCGLMTSGVFTVDSIRIRNDYRNYYHKHFYLRNHAAHDSTLEMIEGVGNVSHPLFLYYYFGQQSMLWTANNCIAGNFDATLSCKSDNGTRVYFNSCIYMAALSSLGSCFVGDSCQYGSGCGGIAQYASKEQVSIYPNPANEMINVGVPSGSLKIINENTTLQITDMLGSIHSTFKIHNSPFQISVADLSEGVYQLTIHNSSFIITKRLVIVR
ncbi:MAG: T9SS type A sorting domain-containing protein [Bacteroidia bacterium]